jgi:hypothetical protein
LIEAAVFILLQEDGVSTKATLGINIWKIILLQEDGVSTKATLGINI